MFLGSYVKLLDVFFAAKQAETVSYTVVFNVLLNQLAYCQLESGAIMQGRNWCKHIAVHLWVFPLHSNHKGHSVSACLWFKKEAILISCTYCNAHCSHCYLSFSHDRLLHANTSLYTVVTANRTIPVPLLPLLQTIDLSNELSELQSNLQTAVKQWQQDRPSYPEESSIIDLVQDGAAATLLQLMEQKQLTLSVHKLHIYRRKWRGDIFGLSADADVDVLFYLYARHLAERQEGQGEGMGHLKHKIMQYQLQFIAWN